MPYKNDTKKYLKLNIVTFLVLFLLSYSSIFIQRVHASQEGINPKELYNIAWEILNEKFYFKSHANLTKWKNKFENKINNINDAHKYISKLTRELKDPYTIFLTQEEFKEEQNIINSSLTGIGVKLANNKPIVLDVLPNSPANIKGIKPNDYILSIDNKNTRNLTSDQILNLLRGPKDSTLTVKIKRDKDILNKILKRQEIEIKAVSTQLLEDNIALIKIESFIPENTPQAFKDEVSKLMSINGLILDLRNNSGGFLKNAVEIADMFLSEGKIVSTITKGVKINEFANSTQLIKSPVIILVNEYTASASEILTSALKENNRALVVGKKTFGKGLVQEIIELPDSSALHVTIGVYLTPQGKNINKSGILPDEIVYENNKQLNRAKEILLDISKGKNDFRIALL